MAIIDKTKEALESPRGQLAAKLLDTIIGNEVFSRFTYEQRADFAVAQVDALLRALQRPTES